MTGLSGVASGARTYEVYVRHRAGAAGLRGRHGHSPHRDKTMKPCAARCDQPGVCAIGRRRRGQPVLLCQAHWEIAVELQKSRARQTYDEWLRRFRRRCQRW